MKTAARASLPTRYGTLEMSVYGTPERKEHVALTVGAIDDGEPVLVRVHSECLTGDVLGSSRCDCGEQLGDSLRLLQEQGRGVLLYLRQEGRGIGLTNKISAYALQEQGFDTVEANLALGLPEDVREYRVAAEMLLDLGVWRVRLLTNNPAKIRGLERHGGRGRRARTAKHAAQPVESRLSEDEAGEDGPPLPEAHGARSRWARIGIRDSRVEYPGMHAMTVPREEAVGCVTAS